MELSIHNLEPIHTALARMACDLNLDQPTFLRWLFPTVYTQKYAISFPNRLDELSQRLPSLLGLSGNVIAERHTFLRALAPFLDADEFEMILHGMVYEYKNIKIPTRSADRILQRVIKYCPMCAMEDRTSTLPNARLRMPHLLFGVRACYKHGCALAATQHNIGLNGQLCNADAIIRSDTTRHRSADPLDVEIARDLACLFSPSCPRPGRKRIAAMLHMLAIDQGYRFGASGRVGIVQLIAGMRENYGKEWLESRGIVLSMKADSWPRNIFSPTPRLLPGIFVALMGRFLKAPLPTLLNLAMDVKPRTERWYRRRNSENTASTGSNHLIRSKETILRKMAENPNATAAKLGSLCGIALNVVRREDPMWLSANFPPPVNKTPKVRKYDVSKDALLAQRIENVSRRLRSRQSRPIRITRTLLQQSAGVEPFGKAWPVLMLPLSEEKLRTLVDDDFSFGKRRVDWLFYEISMGRRRPTSTVGQVLSFSATSHLAEKEPRICDYIRERLTGAVLPARYPEALVAEVCASALDEADEEIAARFSREGRRSVSGSPFSASIICYIRRIHNITALSGKKPGERTVHEMSKKFGVKHGVVYYWLNHGIVMGRRRRAGRAIWIALSDEKERELYALVENSKRLRRKDTTELSNQSSSVHGTSADGEIPCGKI